jgi:ABC-type branched-subunit amino acid transport system substrate-binding protein
MPKLSIDTMFYTMLSHTEGMKNVAVIYTDSTYGKEMASQFTYYMMDDVTSNTKVVDQVCNPDIYTEIPNCLKKWKALDVDTVFIFSDLDGVYTYLPIIEEMDNDINVYLSSDYESFFLTEYYDYLSKYDNVYQMSSVQYDYNAELEEFCQRYSDTYGTRPDSTMVQIYDDIMIIAKAIAYNGVRTREDLKEFLDTTDDIGSIYGEGLYFKNNSIQNKMMFVQSYDSNGELTSSIGFTNTEIYEIWWYYYAEELIDEYAKVGEYDSE